MNLGFTLTSGNTKTRTLATGANLARETQKDKVTMYANYARSTSVSNLFGVTKNDVVRGGWRYQYLVLLLAADEVADESVWRFDPS
jgi:Protein of unknown function, DUF481